MFYYDFSLIFNVSQGESVFFLFSHQTTPTLRGYWANWGGVGKSRGLGLLQRKFGIFNFSLKKVELNWRMDFQVHDKSFYTRNDLLFYNVLIQSGGLVRNTENIPEIVGKLLKLRVIFRNEDDFYFV